MTDGDTSPADEPLIPDPTIEDGDPDDLDIDEGDDA